MCTQFRILSGVAGKYIVHDATSGYTSVAVPRGIFRRQGIKPLPGDWAVCEDSGNPAAPWTITSLNERSNSLIRPPAANIDLLLLTVAASVPRLDYFWLDKMIAYACFLNIKLAFVVCKADEAAADLNIAEFKEQYATCGWPILIQALDDEVGLGELRQLIAGKTVILAGQSGVGKSTLLNRLLGYEGMTTGRLSPRIQRGKQTTRSVEFFYSHGAYIADTPGFQSVEPFELGLSAPDLLLAYPELSLIASSCSYRDCKHLGEAGCAVADSSIAPKRLERYRILRQKVAAINKY